MTSDKLFSEAKQYIPGGVNSPVRAYGSVGMEPPFISKAKGSHIFDEDGREFIDYVLSWGPMILGHGDKAVIGAVQKACENGLSFGAPTGKETVLAKLIVEAVLGIEKVRLVNSGTEAVMSAIRLARGYTGRDKIIKFRGNYHGHSDGLLVEAGSGLLTGSTPNSAGVPLDYAKNTLLADYNDLASVEELFRNNKNEVAAVIVEPVAANMGVVPPKDGFLQGLRKLTEEHGALLIFDEVITGFRLAYGGAGEYFGVTPDLITLGKIVGGGMPLAAYGGKAVIMDRIAPVGDVYQAGTLSGNPIAVTAGIVTLTRLKEENKNCRFYKDLEDKSKKLEAAYLEKGLQVNREGSLFSVFFTDEKVVDERSAKTSDTKAFAAYFKKMFEAGIYVAPSQFEAMFLSAAHSPEDIERTIQVIRGL